MRSHSPCTRSPAAVDGAPPRNPHLHNQVLQQLLVGGWVARQVAHTRARLLDHRLDGCLTCCQHLEARVIQRLGVLTGRRQAGRQAGVQAGGQAGRATGRRAAYM
jgi:hypothetical protein